MKEKWIYYTNEIIDSNFIIRVTNESKTTWYCTCIIDCEKQTIDNTPSGIYKENRKQIKIYRTVEEIINEHPWVALI